MNYITLILALLLFYISGIDVLYGQSISRSDNLLTIQNQTLRVVLSYNGGEVELNSIENTQIGKNYFFRDRKPCVQNK